MSTHLCANVGRCIRLREVAQFARGGDLQQASTQLATTIVVGVCTFAEFAEFAEFALQLPDGPGPAVATRNRTLLDVQPSAAVVLVKRRHLYFLAPKKKRDGNGLRHQHGEEPLPVEQMGARGPRGRA
jgi:hypothetical protein